MKTHTNICLSTGQEWGNVIPFNLDRVHARYNHVLTIFKGSNKNLAEALRQASVARNTIRDFLGMSELKLLDERKYEETVARVRREKTKPSVKDFKKACRSQVLEYYDEVSEKKVSEKKLMKDLLPLMTHNFFYEK